MRQYPNGKALTGATYEWDFLTEFGLLQDWPDEVRSRVKLQALTPRYGYDVPTEIEAAAIFDQSLQLQSTLQARGFTTESQYATLLGHKQRWNIVITWNELSRLTLTGEIKEDIASALSSHHNLLSGYK